MEIAAADVDRERDCDQFRDPGEDAVGCEMTAPLVVFFALAGLAVIGAVSLIFQKHPIHSALSLIVVMVALAGLYLLLGAEFVAAVQIIVYGGAIMVLFVFVIMLLNAAPEERTDISKLAHAGVILPLVGVLGAFLAVTIARGTSTMHAVAPNAGQGLVLTDTRALSHMLFK